MGVTILPADEFTAEQLALHDEMRAEVEARLDENRQQQPQHGPSTETLTRAVELLAWPAVVPAERLVEILEMARAVIATAVVDPRSTVAQAQVARAGAIAHGATVEALSAADLAVVLQFVGVLATPDSPETALNEWARRTGRRDFEQAREALARSMDAAAAAVDQANN